MGGAGSVVRNGQTKGIIGMSKKVVNMEYPTSIEACRDLRFLVASTGRSGSRWIAGVWTNLGFPCSHERIFNPWLRAKPHSFVCDASQQSGAVLKEVKEAHPHILVFHQLRNPYDYVASMYGEGSSLLRPSTNERFLLKYIDMDAEDAVSASMQLWVKWNDRIAPYADFTYHVEACNVGKMKEMLALLGEKREDEEILDAFRTERNVHLKRWKLDREEVRSSSYFPEFEEAMKRYGY